MRQRWWMVSIAVIGLLAVDAYRSRGIGQDLRSEGAAPAANSGASSGGNPPASATTAAEQGAPEAPPPPAAAPSLPGRGEEGATSVETRPAPASIPAAMPATAPAGPVPGPVPVPTPTVVPVPAAPVPAAPVPADTVPATTVPATPTTTAPTESARKDLRLLVRPGAHLAAQRAAIHAPFVTRTGTAIDVQAWPAGAEALPLAKDGAARWDVAEVGSHAARKACEAGLVERIELKTAASGADQPAVERDTIVDGVTPCSVASAVWSSLVVFDRRIWTGQAEAAEAGKAVSAKRQKARTGTTRPPPATLRDVFDVAGYPGKRALRKSPRHLLEMALMADGVAPDEVYRTLATDDGARRAFARLESLRGHVVWVEQPAEAGKLVTDRAAVMAMIYSGRAFQVAAVEGKPLGQIWDGQLYHLEAWVIAKGTPRIQAARAFLDVATAPERQAAQARLFPYGPPRASAVAQVGRHPVLNIDMTPHLPTAPANLRNALAFDEAFWERHAPQLNERFEAWLKAPLAPPAAAPGGGGLPVSTPGATPAMAPTTGPNSDGTGKSG